MNNEHFNLYKDMKYVIVTVEWCEGHGISVPEHARKSLDGTKVLFHDEYIRPVMTTADFARDAQDIPAVYAYDDPTFREILASSEWSEPETTVVGDAQTGDDSTAEDGAQKEEW